MIGLATVTKCKKNQLNRSFGLGDMAILSLNLNLNKFEFESNKSLQKLCYWIDLNNTKNLPLVSSSLDLRLKSYG